MTKRVTKAEIKQGYIVCECEKYAHIIAARIVDQLPKDYTAGEYCYECNTYVVDVDKLKDVY